MRIQFIIWLYVILGLQNYAAMGTVYEVPQTYPVIQEAINASTDGDTVLVGNGYYRENIDFLGKKITIGSMFILSGDTSYITNTVIDGGGLDSNRTVVAFLGGEDSLSILSGFTITNGWADGEHGGGITLLNGVSPTITYCRINGNAAGTGFFHGIGIYCAASSPTFDNCEISGNSALNNGNWDHFGGGVCLLSGSAPVFNNCVIKDNQISVSVYWRNYGGGVFSDNSYPVFNDCQIIGNNADFGGGIEGVNTSIVTLKRCRLSENFARANGGAIFSFGSSVFVIDTTVLNRNSAGQNGGALYTEQNGDIQATGCTVTNNTAGLGAALYGAPGTSPAVTNSILFYNWHNEIYPEDLTQISYCDIRGGYAGTGNFDFDPLFCDWANDDYYLANNSLCMNSSSTGGLIGSQPASCDAVLPQTRLVPQEYSSIQEAILSSYQGDTILVDQGTYRENIDFWGRRVFLTSYYLQSQDTSDISLTMIDGGGSDSSRSVLSLIRNEDSLSVAYGLTLMNGWAQDEHGGGVTIINCSGPRIDHCRVINNVGAPSYMKGGGIYCANASPTIIDCLIQNNSAPENQNYDHYGGGLYISSGSAPSINRCIIRDNQLAFSIYHRNYGGAVYCEFSTPTFQNCFFDRNSADYGGGVMVINSDSLHLNNCVIVRNSGRDDGGGIFSNNSKPEIINTTFSKNSAGHSGGAVFSLISTTDIINSILWADSAIFEGNEIYTSIVDSPAVSYSDIEGGWPGEENIQSDPVFQDTVNYYLLTGSPCIDAGNPAVDYQDPEDSENPGFALFPALGGLRNDMGAYGGPGSYNLNILVTTVHQPEASIGAGIPKQPVLYQNYPNPFNPKTLITYELSSTNFVNLSIYNLIGQKVATPVDKKQPAGIYHVQWDASDFATGVYYYKIDVGKYHPVKKMILIK